MTSPTAAEYPRSTNWQDFERLSCALLSAVFNRRFQRWGRPGQRQYGVDAWLTLETGKTVVLQCKGRNGNLGRVLTTTDLDAAIEETNTFPHPIEELIVLTTAPDDQALHNYATDLTASRILEGKCSISVWGWNTISDHIGQHKKIQMAFFGSWFQRVSIWQWLMMIAFTVLLLGGTFVGLSRLQESHHGDNQRREESIKALRQFAALVDDLASSYELCEKAMVDDNFLFGTDLRKSCTDPAGARISAIEKQVENITPYLDKEALSEISDQTMLIREDYRQALIALEMINFFEEDVIREIKLMCPPSRSADLIDETEKQVRDSGHHAMVAQLNYYFVLRDFVLPGISAMKARTLVQARQLAGESIPPQLLDQANALASLVRDRRAFQFKAPGQPFSLSAVKAMSDRNITIHGEESSMDFVEQARWNNVFARSLTKVLYGRPKDVEALIQCGVLKPDARSLVTGY
jgi:hypothetical protein